MTELHNCGRHDCVVCAHLPLISAILDALTERHENIGVECDRCHVAAAFETVDQAVKGGWANMLTFWLCPECAGAKDETKDAAASSPARAGEEDEGACAGGPSHSSHGGSSPDSPDAAASPSLAELEERYAEAVRRTDLLYNPAPDCAFALERTAARALIDALKDRVKELERELHHTDQFAMRNAANAEAEEAKLKVAAEALSHIKDSVEYKSSIWRIAEHGIYSAKIGSKAEEVKISDARDETGGLLKRQESKRGADKGGESASSTVVAGTSDPSDIAGSNSSPASSAPLPEAVAKARVETDGTPSQPFDGERNFLLALDRERHATDAAFAEKDREIARLKAVIEGRKTIG